MYKYLIDLFTGVLQSTVWYQKWTNGKFYEFKLTAMEKVLVIFLIYDLLLGKIVWIALTLAIKLATQAK